MVVGFFISFGRIIKRYYAEKYTFREKFRCKIEQLQKQIAEEYRKEIQLEVVMDYDIEKLKKRQNNCPAFRDVLYHKYSYEDPDLGHKFAFRCADKGIADACLYIANLLYSGEDSMLPLSEENRVKLKQNFGEAAKYYKMGFSIYSTLNICPETIDCERLRYISLCKNGIIHGWSMEKCDDFLNSNRENIEEYKAGDYTFYKFTDFRAHYGEFYRCHDIIVY